MLKSKITLDSDFLEFLLLLPDSDPLLDIDGAPDSSNFLDVETGQKVAITCVITLGSLLIPISENLFGLCNAKYEDLLFISTDIANEQKLALKNLPLSLSL